MSDATAPTSEPLVAVADRASGPGELLGLLMLFTGPLIVFATAFLLAR